MLQDLSKEWRKLTEQTKKYTPGRILFYGLYGALVVLLIGLTTWGVVRGIFYPELIDPENRTSATHQVLQESN